MPKNDVVTCLDLGSHRVSCMMGRVDPETRRVEVLGSAVAPCLGLKGGVVVNIADAARAVTRAVEDAEAQAQTTVREVVLGICGSHIHSFNNSGKFTIARTDKEITVEDVCTRCRKASRSTASAACPIRSAWKAPTSKSRSISSPPRART